MDLYSHRTQIRQYMVLKSFIEYVSYVPVLTARSAIMQGLESKNNIKISYASRLAGRRQAYLQEL
jgi:hypothetical protein